jgi:hypothetical protein
MEALLNFSLLIMDLLKSAIIATLNPAETLEQRGHKRRGFNRAIREPKETR